MEVQSYRMYSAIRTLHTKHLLADFSDDVATFAGEDGYFRSFSIPDLAETKEPTRFEEPLGGLKWNTIGHHLIILKPAQIECMNSRTGQRSPPFELGEWKDYVAGSSQTEFGDLIALTAPGSSSIRRLPDFRELPTPEHTHPTEFLRGLRCDGPDILYVDDEGELSAFDADGHTHRAHRFAWTDALRERLKPALAGGTMLRVSPCGRRLLVLADRSAILVPCREDAATTMPAEATNFTSGQNTWGDFSPDGKWIIAGSNGDPSIKVFHADSLAPAASLDSHEQTVSAPRFSMESRWILTVDGRFTARVWPVPGLHGTDWRHLLPQTAGSQHASWFPNGDLWFGLKDSAVRVQEQWSRPALTINTPLPGTAVNGLVPLSMIAPGATGVLIAGKSSTISIFNTDSQPLRKFALDMPGAQSISNLRLSPDGELVAAGGADSSLVRVWRTSDWSLAAERRLDDTDSAKKTLAGGPRVRSLRWSKDSRVLFAAGPGGLVHRLNPRTESLEQVGEPLALHGGDQIRNATPSPDGRTLVTLGDDRVVRLWDLPSMRLRAERASLASDPFTASFHPQSTTVAIGDRAGNVTIIDTRSGVILASFTSKGPITSLAFDPDGTRLAVGGSNAGAEILDFGILASSLRSSRAFWNERHHPKPGDKPDEKGRPGAH